MLALVTDSSANLTRDEARRLGVEVVPMTFVCDGVARAEAFMGENGDVDALVREGHVSATAGVTAAAFEAVFRTLTDRGDDVVCITLSSKLSGTYRHARDAADAVRSDLRRAAGATSREANSAAAARTAGLPRIAVLDSQTGISGMEFLVRAARQLADGAGSPSNGSPMGDPGASQGGLGASQGDAGSGSFRPGDNPDDGCGRDCGRGYDFDELFAELEARRARQGLCFSVPSTEALRTSGRMALVPQSVGTLLNRFPVLTVEDGAVRHLGTARGLAGLARDMVGRVPPGARDVVITHFGARNAAAAELLREAKAALPQAQIRVKEGGPVLSYILGPGSVSLTWDVATDEGVEA